MMSYSVTPPLIPPLHTDLVQPLVTVRSDGNSTAGETFSLVCIVETEEGVRSEDVSIEWAGPNGTVASTEGSGDNIEIEGVGNVTRDRLVFSPLHTSDRGQYTCTGRISVVSVGVAVSSSDSIHINVTSKCCIPFNVVYSSCVLLCLLSPCTRCDDICQW